MRPRTGGRAFVVEELGQLDRLVGDVRLGRRADQVRPRRVRPVLLGVHGLRLGRLHAGRVHVQEVRRVGAHAPWSPARVPRAPLSLLRRSEPRREGQAALRILTAAPG